MKIKMLKKKRLESLSKFQKELITHALKFPSVKKLVYSTCSIHKEENEEVVQNILKTHSNFQLIKALPEWKRRGLKIFEGSENCVRTEPKEDKTHGFFVSCFEKIIAIQLKKKIKRYQIPQRNPIIQKSMMIQINQNKNLIRKGL